MFKKLLKDQKGTALVFVIVLIVNALMIVSSIVFISVVQKKASGKMNFTPAAYQKADSGLEYILKEINHNLTDPSDDLGDLCDNFDDGRCGFDNLPGVSAYFFNDSGDVMSSSELINDIKEVKTVGEAGTKFNRVSRSLKTILFVAP